MKYALGARRSHPSKLAAARLAIEHPCMSGNMAVATKLVACVPPRQDQGQTGECTVHGMSAGLYASCLARGAALPYVPSQRELYAISGAIERAAAVPAGDTLPALQDNGRELADVVTAVATCGVSPQIDPDPTRNSDGTPANATDEPDVGALEAADADKLSGAYRIDLGSASAVQQASIAIDSGIAIYVGFFCDSAFQALGPNDVAQVPDQSDPTGGGHCVFLADHRAAADGTTEFLIVNSWGTSWADNGTVWASQAFFLSMWEAWLLDETLIANLSEAK